jgi:hypothetical protein
VTFRDIQSKKQVTITKFAADTVKAGDIVGLFPKQKIAHGPIGTPAAGPGVQPGAENTLYQRIVSEVLTMASAAVLRDAQNRPADFAQQPEAPIRSSTD